MDAVFPIKDEEGGLPSVVGLGVRVSHGLVMDFTVCVPMTVAGVRPAQTERR